MLTAQMTGTQTAAGARSARTRAGAATAPVGVCAGAFAASTVDVADWLQCWTWAPSMGALVLLVYVFPDGALPPGRWRWGAFATIAAARLLLVVQPFLGWPYRGLILWERAPAGAAGQILSAVAFAAMAASLQPSEVRVWLTPQVVQR